MKRAIKKTKYLLQCDLLGRGWTKSLIEQFLGPPDCIRRRYEGGSCYLYDCKRVVRAEKRKSLKIQMEEVAARREGMRLGRLERATTALYMEEVQKPIGDEETHWANHPEVDPYMVGVRRRKQIEFLEKHGILASLFSVNRTAKRIRDQAKAAYQKGDYELATKLREIKEEYYYLKDQALEHLWRDGYLERTGGHFFEGGIFMELLVGGGYKFHRPCRVLPPGIPHTILPEIEARAVEVNEVPIGEALEAVRGFLQNKSFVEVYELPGRQLAADVWGEDDSVDAMGEMGDVS